MDARTLCLGVINDRPATGYDIKKAVEEGPFQHFFGISYGSIYPTLTKLLDDGEIAVSQALEVNGHPSKRRFEITPKGRKEFRRQLETFDTKDKFRSEFVLAMFYFDELSLDQQIAVLDKRIRYLREDLKEIEAHKIEASSRPSDQAQNADCDQCPELPGREKLLDFARTLRSTELDYLESYQQELLDQRSGASSPDTSAVASSSPVTQSPILPSPAETASSVDPMESL